MKKIILITAVVLAAAACISGCASTGSTGAGSKGTIVAGLSPGNVFNSFGMEFVYIGPGTFEMGSPGGSKFGIPQKGMNIEVDEIQHKVILTKGFYMQTTEVTQAQWEEVMGSNPSRFSSCSECPVEMVSWNDVQNFIKNLNTKGQGTYRLPTEAEWEYACRSGTSTRFCFGYADAARGHSQLDSYAWYILNAGFKTHPVAQKKANTWGLYDMHGNVWEWCQDWYGDYPEKSVTDPSGPSKGFFRVKRGGGWRNYVEACRSANRVRYTPTGKYSNLGFRLVRVE